MKPNETNTYLAPLSALNTWNRNYRIGAVDAIITSIARFGFNGVLKVCKDNTVMAGNHSLLALRQMKAHGADVPHGIVAQDGEWFVPCVDVSHLSKPESELYAIADNRTSDLAENDNEVLAELLTELASEDSTLLEAAGYTPDDLEQMLSELRPTDEGENEEDDDDLDLPLPDGALLALSNITIAEPTHRVERGDVWQLGGHILICADVLKDWQQWLPFLVGEDVLFAPYPGAFVPLVERKDGKRFVMVQPDAYIAGHILDRYTDIHGGEHVQKAS